MDAIPFSFAELERRVSAVPEGPIAILNRPQWQYWCDLGGGIGVILGLLPSLLIQFFEPKPWMVTMGVFGLAIMATLFAPGFLRSIWVFAGLVRRGRAQDAAQLDHDFAELDRLQVWLSAVPKQALEHHLRFVQAALTRIAEKLSLMGGDISRFGVLPLILAIAVQIKAFDNGALGIPIWQLAPGLFFAVIYLVGLNAAFMRVRMQLYEIVLTEALARRAISGT
jgi:hypothetical protein